jgi:hypothetical protein
MRIATEFFLGYVHQNRLIASFLHHDLVENCFVLNWVFNFGLYPAVMAKFSHDLKLQVFYLRAKRFVMNRRQLTTKFALFCVQIYFLVRTYLFTHSLLIDHRPFELEFVLFQSC